MLLFLFDLSGSQRDSRVLGEQCRQAAVIVRKIWQPNKVGVILGFAQSVRILGGPSDDAELLAKTIEDVPHQTFWGPTSLYDALISFDKTKLSDSSRSKNLVVFSDFQDNSSKTSVSGVQEYLRATSLRVFAFLPPSKEQSVQRSAASRKASRMAGELVEGSGGRVWELKSVNDVEKSLHGLRSALDFSYRLTYSSGLTGKESERDLKIECTRRNVRLIFAPKVFHP